jgi:hypothetical protein
VFDPQKRHFFCFLLQLRLEDQSNETKPIERKVSMIVVTHATF